MIVHFLRRVAEAWGYLGLPCYDRRIGPVLAWELALIWHPSPAQDARNRAEIDECIAWARAMRARIEAEGGDDV